MSKIKNLSDILVRNKEVMVIDMLDHVMQLEEKHLQALVEPPKGIYVVGSIEPIVRADSVYYPKHKYPDKDSAIKFLEDILNLDDDLVDATGKTILTLKDIRAKRKYLKTEPSIPVTAVKLAIGVVLNYLNNLCSHTRVDYYSYRQELFVKEECKDLITSEEFVTVFEHLLDQVMSYVGKDTWHIYFYTVKGTSLVIEKACDFRVYDWHRIQLEKEEAHSSED